MEYAYLSQKAGREVNEDSVRICEKNGTFCFIVADGLGGHGRGEEASALVCQRIEEYFLKIDSSVECIEGAIEFAQKALLEEQRKKGAFSEMKTTVVVLILDSKGLCRWGHVGDSRLYCFKKEKIKAQTSDHSVPQMLAMAGDIKPEEIRFHPDRNKLLRVMGVEWNRKMYETTKAKKIRRKSSFLLCTDGFWELIDEEKIASCWKQSVSAEEWLSKMETIILQNGREKEMDNYSAIVVRI